MTTRFPALLLGSILAVGGLAACSSNSVPNTYASMSQGVGFGDYQRHLRAQEAARRTNPPYSIPPETRAPASAPGAPMQTIASQPLGQAPSQSRPLPPTTAPVVTIPANQGSADPQARPGAIPDTTTFQAVPFGQRPQGAEIPPVGETEIVRVTSVPGAGTSSGPNVMAYALRTRHAVGTPMHNRNNPLRWARWERNCLQFANQDLAQEAFLAAGGPERDPNHLDPDGDGFACWWDPQIYRRAAAQAETVQGSATE